MNISDHRNSLPTGYKLQQYRIEEVLGQGGFGITYLAYDEILGRHVAIKEYLPMDMAVREGDASIQPVSGEFGNQFKRGLDRFIKEAQTLARFNHPNVVSVFNVFSVNNTAYMVMGYEMGLCLNQVLKRCKTLPESDIKKILFPILDGLEHIHECGIIHRDIKPANIFIRNDGVPVLLDFGSARQSIKGQARTLTAMYSPGFAPFEQYTGKSQNQGPWTDIYGLGATMYKCITGRAPVDAMDRGESLLQADRDIYVTLQEIDPAGYSSGFIRAIDLALRFRPAQRPISIASWRDMINTSNKVITDHSQQLTTQSCAELLSSEEMEARTSALVTASGM